MGESLGPLLALLLLGTPTPSDARFLKSLRKKQEGSGTERQQTQDQKHTSKASYLALQWGVDLPKGHQSGTRTAINHVFIQFITNSPITSVMTNYALLKFIKALAILYYLSVRSRSPSQGNFFVAQSAVTLILSCVYIIKQSH